MHSMPPLRVMPTGMRARMHFQVADQRPSFWSILLTVHTEACKRRQRGSERVRQRAASTSCSAACTINPHFHLPFVARRSTTAATSRCYHLPCAVRHSETAVTNNSQEPNLAPYSLEVLGRAVVASWMVSPRARGDLTT